MKYYIFNTEDKKFFKKGSGGGMTLKKEEFKKYTKEVIERSIESRNFQNGTLIKVPCDLSKIKLNTFVDFDLKDKRFYSDGIPTDFLKDVDQPYDAKKTSERCWEIKLYPYEVRIPLDYEIIGEEKEEPIQYYLFNQNTKEFFLAPCDGMTKHISKAHKYSMSNNKMEESFINFCINEDIKVLLIPCDLERFEVETFTDYNLQDKTFYNHGRGRIESLKDVQLANDPNGVYLWDFEIRIPIKFRLRGEQNWIEQKYKEEAKVEKVATNIDINIGPFQSSGTYQALEKPKVRRSTKVFDGFSTIFRQHKATGTHCRFLHGYGISFKVTFEGELDERNWVWDFGGMKRANTQIDGMSPKAWMDYMFDHTTIIAEDDPMLFWFKSQQAADLIQLRIIPATGAEKFAEYIFNKLNQFVKTETENRVRVVEVEFKEHEKNSATYGE